MWDPPAGAAMSAAAAQAGANLPNHELDLLVGQASRSQVERVRILIEFPHEYRRIAGGQLPDDVAARQPTTRRQLDDSARTGLTLPTVGQDVGRRVLQAAQSITKHLSPPHVLPVRRRLVLFQGYLERHQESGHVLLAALERSAEPVVGAVHMVDFLR